MSEVWIPDRLLNYERELFRVCLEQHGHNVVFAPLELQAEGIVTGGPPLDEQVLRGMPRLKAVVRFASGQHDSSDESALLRRLGVGQARLVGLSAQSTAEHTIMLMLVLLRRLNEATNAMAKGRWEQVELAEKGLRDLAGVTVGLIGLGHVGWRVALLLRAFGTRVLYCKRRRLSEEDEKRLGLTWADLDILLGQADIVSLHLRSPGTRVLTGDKLDRLRKGACVINTSAGGYVDEEALVERVLNGSLEAGLDVFATEPWALEQATVSSSRMVLTPHVAGRSRGTAQLLAERAAAELNRLLGPKRPGFRTGAAIGRAGPVLCHVLRQLAPGGLLEWNDVEVAESLVADLPNLTYAFHELGWRDVCTIPDDSPQITLATGNGRLRVLLEPPSDGTNRHGPHETSSACSSALAFVVERWIIDYAVWDRLLPRSGRGSLPGQSLVIHGYDHRQRLVAWRAREIGLKVTIAEPDPQPRLEAVYDGFYASANVPGSPPLQIRASELSGQNWASKGSGSGLRRALQDEFTAWAIIALHVIERQSRDASGPFSQESVVALADKLFLDALASVRDEYHESDSSIWRTYRW